MRGAWLMVAVVGVGGCCSSGPPRLASVSIEGDQAASARVEFDGSVAEFPTDGFFRVTRIGAPDAGRLTTTPMLEMFDADGNSIALERFTASNEDGNCGNNELYEPPDSALTVGASYDLVHAASASPGELEHSGGNVGSLEQHITTFRGERALVARIVAAAPTASGGGGAGGGG